MTMVTDAQMQANPNLPNSQGVTLNDLGTGWNPAAALAQSTNVTADPLGGLTGLQMATWALQQVAGFSPSDAASLANYYWNFATKQGITDAGTLGEYINADLPSQPVFQKNFPGYAGAIAAGYVRSIPEYVASEEGITATMLQGGVPADLINPATVGDLIAKGVSPNEVATRVTNGLDAAMNAPAEVQNYFEQQFGAGNGVNALAQTFLNPDIDQPTLMKMLAGAQVRGAAAASNLTVSQGLSQRLADQGETYASAQAKFKNLSQEAGLFQQTVGEQSSQAPVPGTQNQNAPLTASNQGVAAEFGLSTDATQQVEQAALARQNEFRGGGGAVTSEQAGYSGLGHTKPL